MQKAIFFDRDGTLNECVSGYVWRWDQWHWRPNAISAIKCAVENGFKIVVVTNQGGIAKGIYTEFAVRTLHERINTDVVRYGLRIDCFKYCPHHPDGIVLKYTRNCNCRKPLPGLLLEAIAEMGINPATSYIVGDQQSDIEAGIAAGIEPCLINRQDDLYSVINALVHRRQCETLPNQFQRAG